MTRTIEATDSMFAGALRPLRCAFEMIAPHLDEDDLLQEARVAVFCAVERGRYDPERGPLEPWVRTVCRNALRDLLNREAALRRCPVVEGLPQAPGPLDDYEDESPDPECEMVAKELEELAHHFCLTLIGALEHRHRDALKYRLHPPEELGEEPTLNDVAGHLGVKVGVVRHSLSRALERGKRIASQPEFNDLKGGRDARA